MTNEVVEPESEATYRQRTLLLPKEFDKKLSDQYRRGQEIQSIKHLWPKSENEYLLMVLLNGIQLVEIGVKQMSSQIVVPTILPPDAEIPSDIATKLRQADEKQRRV